MLRITFLLVFVAQVSWACVCKEQGMLSLQECGKYDWIGYGVVDEVEECPEGIIKFSPISIFKGEYAKQVELKMDCDVDCQHDAHAGDTWIFYAEKDNGQELNVGFCSHSRKKMPEGIADFQTGINGMTFDKEMLFLKDHFTVKTKSSKRELKAKKYEKIESRYIPILLGAGLLFMVVGYFVFNKIVKK
jgi:hypothetical protein